MKSRLVAGVIHKRVIYDTLLLSQLASAIGWCDHTATRCSSWHAPLALAFDNLPGCNVLALRGWRSG